MKSLVVISIAFLFSCAPCYNNVCSSDLSEEDILASVLVIQEQQRDLSEILYISTPYVYVIPWDPYLLPGSAETTNGATHINYNIWGDLAGNPIIYINENRTRCWRCETLVHELLHVYLVYKFNVFYHLPGWFSISTDISDVSIEEKAEMTLYKQGFCGCVL